MIDSVLKGTGNSRFLKSAVPSGTSWADALAMLQAGTFPIDFNGINAEGFQQVGTPLNKANLLKDATAAQIGLPPSTTPDGMFQALGNTGELHVWRKTVTTAQEIPAGYTLGSTEENVLIASRETSYMAGALYYYYGNSITVSDNGDASNPASDSYEMIGRGYTTAKTILSGPVFVKCATDYISSSTGQQIAMPTKEGLSLFFIPSGGNLVVTVSDYPGNSSIKVVSVVATKYQLVNAYPLTPAGTTATYPVSTNPNAYQEGDDAKPAGYTLGDVVSGNFQFGYPYSSNTGFRMDASASVSVDDNGNVSLAAPITSRTINKANVNTKAEIEQLMLGKYVIADKYAYPHSDDIPGGIVIYIPSDATINMDTDAGSWRLSKYQPVTGYAAIPAVTTIEYLGKLGDKARIQIISYVGTGTDGSAADPITLTFPFAPKYARYIYNFEYAEIPLTSLKSDSYIKYHWGSTSSGRPVPTKISGDGKTLSWYGNYGADYASNSQGTKYSILIVG